MHLNKRLLQLGRIVVAFLLVGFLAWRAGIGDLGGSGLQMSWGFALAALLGVPLSVVLRAYNHALLLNRPVRVLRLSQAVTLTLVGSAASLILPMGAADLVKARWGLRSHGNAEAMVVSSVLDKVTSLTAVAAMGAVGAIVTGRTVIALASIALAVATVLPFIAPRLIPWRLLLRLLASNVEVDKEMVEQVSRPPWRLLGWVYTVSVAGWLLTYVVMWASLRAVGLDLGFATVLTFGPISTVARLIPVSIGGIGVGEAALAVLLEQVGAAPDMAARGVLLSMAFLVIFPGAIGAIILARGRASAKIV